ncbi:MAG TPA: hypothetical protein VMT38_02865 [Terracidiphilus sp.]|nr:hypothetical protein [Terracidiphilus sp.]
MKSPAKCAVWLLPFALTGCFHLPFQKTQPPKAALAPPIDVPRPPIQLVSIELPPGQRLIPGKPLYNMSVRDETVKPPIHRRRLPSPTEIVGLPDAGQAPNGVSAIGQLAAGDPASYRQQTEADIASIQRGLDGIHRTLSDSDQKTADQIREFLKQANTALASGDVDGARTLAAKAQVLLAGLTQ